MKILVTGATGFIGQHVIQELVKTDHEIVATALERQPRLPNLPLQNKVTYIPCNLNEEKADYWKFFTCPDSIIHLSWEGLPHYKELFHFERNLPSNYRFLKNLIQNGLKDISIIGTCLEYGMRNGPLSEDMTTHPTTAYALAKDSLRRFLEELRKESDFHFRWIRLFYTYGDGQNENSLIEQLKKAVARGDTTFEMSKGDQLRDYLPVEKVAEYIVRVSLQTRVQGIINCCSGLAISIRELVENYLRTTKTDLRLKLGAHPYADYEAKAFWGDTKKLFSILNDQR